jgi:hypothetical protein
MSDGKRAPVPGISAVIAIVAGDENVASRNRRGGQVRLERTIIHDGVGLPVSAFLDDPAFPVGKLLNSDGGRNLTGPPSSSSLIHPKGGKPFAGN